MKWKLMLPKLTNNTLFFSPPLLPWTWRWISSRRRWIQTLIKPRPHLIKRRRFTTMPLPWCDTCQRRHHRWHLAGRGKIRHLRRNGRWAVLLTWYSLISDFAGRKPEILAGAFFSVRHFYQAHVPSSIRVGIRWIEPYPVVFLGSKGNPSEEFVIRGVYKGEFEVSRLNRVVNRTVRVSSTCTQINSG